MSYVIDLVKKDESRVVARGIRRVMVGCGWDPQKDRSTSNFDLDVSCIMLNERGRMPTNRHYVFYNNLRFNNDVVIHTGDNLTGDGDGDDERLLIDLGRMDRAVARIDLYYNIYQGTERRQTFGMISDCYIRICDVTHERDTSEKGPLYQSTSYADREFCRSEVNDEALHGTCLLFGSLIRTLDDRGSSSWSFRVSQKEVYGGIQRVLELVEPEPIVNQSVTAVRFQDSAVGRTMQLFCSREAVMQTCQDYRAVFGLIGVGAILLNSIGVVPLIFLGAFILLSMRGGRDSTDQ